MYHGSFEHLRRGLDRRGLSICLGDGSRGSTLDRKALKVHQVGDVFLGVHIQQRLIITFQGIDARLYHHEQLVSGGSDLSSSLAGTLDGLFALFHAKKILTAIGITRQPLRDLWIDLKVLVILLDCGPLPIGLGLLSNTLLVTTNGLPELIAKGLLRLGIRRFVFKYLPQFGVLREVEAGLKILGDAGRGRDTQL